jgi:uncharacterized protein
MTGEREINYEGLVQDAMRGVVRTVLARVAKTGLPGEHHFYIAFRTDAPGVSLSPRLKEKYPEEMTVVLQHRFWDLIVREASFEVKLTFDGIPERLSVPFDAIKVFFDPSVPYGLQFEDLDASGAAEQQPVPKGEAASPEAAPRSGTTDRTAEPSQARAEKKPRASRRPPPAEKTGERVAGSNAGKTSGKPLPAPALAKPAEAAESKGPKVVSIDAFRKK